MFCSHIYNVLVPCRCPVGCQRMGDHSRTRSAWFWFTSLALICFSSSSEVAADESVRATCSRDPTSDVKQHSLLQLSGLPRQRLQDLRDMEDADMDSFEEQGSPSASLLSLTSEHSDAGLRAKDLMERAAEEARLAEISMADNARNTAQVAQSMDEVHHSSEGARKAQEIDAKRLDDLGEALAETLRKVQGAADVEQHELSVKALATRRLEDAAKNAREVQQIENENIAREAQTAALLQEVTQRFDSPDGNHGTSVQAEALQAVEDAEKFVEARASEKVRASQLLQSSLEGAALAVEDLKRGKETQTAAWLRDASANLVSTQSALRKTAQAQSNVAGHLEATAIASNSAQALAADTAARQKSVVQKMHDVAQQVRSAQDAASQEAAAASILHERARQSRNDPGLQDMMPMQDRAGARSSGIGLPMASPQYSAAALSPRSSQNYMQEVGVADAAQQVPTPTQVGFAPDPRTINLQRIGTGLTPANIVTVGESSSNMQGPAIVQGGFQFAPASNYLQNAAVREAPQNFATIGQSSQSARAAAQGGFQLAPGNNYIKNAAVRVAPRDFATMEQSSQSTQEAAQGGSQQSVRNQYLQNVGVDSAAAGLGNVVYLPLMPAR